jgi:hypothetical protein
MAKKTNLSFNVKILVAAIIVLALVVIFSGTSQTAKFSAPSTTKSVLTPFSVDGWGSLGWTSCNNMAGGIAGANSFCKCKGYANVYQNGTSACFNEWRTSRWAWVSAINSSACIAQGKATGAGYATTLIKCVNPCSDSDGGEDLKVSGACTDKSGTYWDTCAGNSTIAEQSCRSGGCATGLKPCPKGCKNGACL